MPNNLVARTAQQNDLPALLDLYRHLISDDPELQLEDATHILGQFERYPGSAIFVGFDGDQLIASCTLVVVPNLTRGGSPYGLIENVVTHADHRERGHGRAILKAAVDAAWRANCYKVMLLTGSTNPATLRFYQQAGFEQNKTGFQVRRIPSRQS